MALPYSSTPGAAPTLAHPLGFDVAYSAGGVCTDATHLARFLTAAAGSATWKEMTNPSPASRHAGSPFGMGLFVGGQVPGTVWSYGINPDPDDVMGGYSAFAAITPRRHVLAILFNTAGGGGGAARTTGQLLASDL